MASKDRAAHEAYWRDVLDRHAASGLSLRAFAAREGLSANTLAYWKYNAARTVREGIDGPRAGSRHRRPREL